MNLYTDFVIEVAPSSSVCMVEYGAVVSFVVDIVPTLEKNDLTNFHVDGLVSWKFRSDGR